MTQSTHLSDEAIEQGKLAGALGRDVLRLQDAMMELWPISDQNGKAIIEKAMADTGNPRAPR